MCKPISKFELPESRKQLVELMQELNFGRIENLHFVAGDPILLDPKPHVVFDYKLGSDNAPRPERERERFVLKSQILELFGILERFGDGVVELIDVKHGLPFRVAIPKAMP